MRGERDGIMFLYEDQRRRGDRVVKLLYYHNLEDCIENTPICQ